MPRLRRRALLSTLALGASLLAVAPVTAAQAATTQVVSKPGPMTKVYRGDVKRRPGAASARAQRLTVVPGAAATPRSIWNVTYTGFTPEAQQAFQAAVNIWAGIITSNVPINVTADFADLGDGVLGYAGPHAIIPISGAGDGTSWYPVALANALKGSDQLPPNSSKKETGADIEASFSSTEKGIYYGTDSNPPANNVDFESIVLHELGHGLGFTGSADYDSGKGHYESPRFIFDYFNVSGQTGGQRLITLSNNSLTLGSAFTSDSVYWDGAQAVSANGGNRVKLYAPNPWEDGSSIAHLDDATFPQGNVNSLMTPFVDNQEVIHTPGPVMIGMMRDMGWDAVLTAPAAPTSVTADSSDSAVEVNWTASTPNGSPVTSYAVKAYNAATNALVSTTSSTTTSATVGSLDDSTAYYFTVSATNAIGTSPDSSKSATVQPAPDTTPPTVAITSPHTSGFGQATGAYTFTGADPGHSRPVLTYTCSLDGAAATACTSPVSYSGYADGSTHSITVIPTDASNNVGAPVTVNWTADAVAPVVASPVLPTYTLASRIGTSVKATDAHGISTYDYVYRRAAFSSGFTASTFPAVWQATTATSVSFGSPQGYTYCFRSRARDTAGNTSAWTPETCTSTGLDDRGLVAGSGWVRETYYKHFLSTDTKTSTVGATLTRTSVQTRRLALVAVKCAKCGVVGVYFNGKLIKNVNLKQTATAYQTVFPIISFESVQSGTVIIKPLTKGAVNYIDGLVMSKV